MGHYILAILKGAYKVFKKRGMRVVILSLGGGKMFQTHDLPNL